MWPSPAEAAALLIKRVTVCRSSGRPFSRGSNSGWSGRTYALPIVVDQGEQVWVQWQVAVVVQLADRDVQPVTGTDKHDRIGAEADELAHP